MLRWFQERVIEDRRSVVIAMKGGLAGTLAIVIPICLAPELGVKGITGMTLVLGGAALFENCWAEREKAGTPYHVRGYTVGLSIGLAIATVGVFLAR